MMTIFIIIEKNNYIIYDLWYIIIIKIFVLYIIIIINDYYNEYPYLLQYSEVIAYLIVVVLRLLWLENYIVYEFGLNLLMRHTFLHCLELIFVL